MSEKRYVISELDPISVLDMNTGDTFPIADGSGFVETIVECLNVLHEKNEQLQARNDRQAKRLGELYELMAKKDWESLTEIIDDFKRCEEQLQREWRTYE